MLQRQRSTSSLLQRTGRLGSSRHSSPLPPEFEGYGTSGNQEFLPLVRYGSEVTAGMTTDEDDPDVDVDVDVGAPASSSSSSSSLSGTSNMKKSTGYVMQDIDDIETGSGDGGSEGYLYLGKRTFSVKEIPSTGLHGRLRYPGGLSKKSDEDTAIMAENEKLKHMLSLYSRFSSMIDVAVSKLFPAGFCWQLAGSLCGFSDNTLGFALCTGFGEALGVITGHVLYTFLKTTGKGGFDPKETIQTALLLGTGTVCSGTSWQPVVNTLQSLGLSFLGVFVGTWVACTYAFNFGLRVGRNLYSEQMSYVEKPTWANGRTDFCLSFTIGGATAFFVGTDTAYHLEQNFLSGIVGITSGDSVVYGAFLAGLSTCLGFVLTQFVFNLVFPKGKCWID